MASTKTQSVRLSTSNGWGLILIQGIAAVILGLFLVTAPASSLVILMTFIGLYWLIAGVLSIVKIFTRTTYLNWFWALVVGVLGIAAGLIVLQHPLWSTAITPIVLVVILGINALLMSLISVIRGLGGDGAGYVVAGIIDFFFGSVLLASPFLGESVLPITIGVIALIGGVATIFTSIHMRGQPSEEVTIEREKRRAA